MRIYSKWTQSLLAAVLSSQLAVVATPSFAAVEQSSLTQNQELLAKRDKDAEKRRKQAQRQKQQEQERKQAQRQKQKEQERKQAQRQKQKEQERKQAQRQKQKEKQKQTQARKEQRRLAKIKQEREQLERERLRLERERRQARNEAERRKIAKQEREIEKYRRKLRDQYRRDQVRKEQQRRWRRQLQRELRRYAHRQAHRREHIRYHDRWDDRYNHWRHYRPVRPVYPSKPAEPIKTPIAYPQPEPDRGWSFEQIVATADNLEATLVEIYQIASDEVQSNPSLEKALPALYGAIEAAQIYSDALEAQPAALELSLYELFFVESRIELAQAGIHGLGFSTKVRENLNLASYYVDELIWQYREQLDEFEDIRDNIAEGDEWRDDYIDTDEAQAQEAFSFWWSRPHHEAYWDLSELELQPTQIVLEAINTIGFRGENGVVGITHLYLEFLDGRRVDLVEEARVAQDSRISEKSGQLVLKHEGHKIALNIEAETPLVGIIIEADSWISPDTEAEIQMSLFGDMPESE